MFGECCAPSGEGIGRRGDGGGMAPWSEKCIFDGMVCWSEW
jgi:hypothetical protein